MTDYETLISILFNLGFKHCKYCNKLFYPQHNRQVHCKPEHRKKFFIDNQVQKRFKERQKEQYTGYIDNNRNYVTGKPNKLIKLGSLNATLTPHRHKMLIKRWKLLKMN